MKYRVNIEERCVSHEEPTECTIQSRVQTIQFYITELVAAYGCSSLWYSENSCRKLPNDDLTSLEKGIRLCKQKIFFFLVSNCCLKYIL